MAISPKVVIYSSKNNLQMDDSDALWGSDTIVDSILDYSPKHSGYMAIKNLKSSLMFVGDLEDILNCQLGNFATISEKYGFEDIIEYARYEDDALKTEKCVLLGYKKHSDKLNHMPVGIYSFTVLEHYHGFVPITVNTDEYIKFNNSEVDNLQKTVNDFFKQRSIYEENGSRHKGASLMYGLPGCGKTSMLNNLINSSEFKDIYVIFIPKNMSFSSLNQFKKMFQGHNILIIMEEMTERMGNGTEDILNFLDGYTSWNNCYVIATTNYPEVLPPNLVDRPGRFNNLIEVKLPSDEQKVYYLQKKGFSEDQISKVLSKTKDFSMDYIAQLVLQSKLQNLPLEDCLAQLENNKKKVKGTFRGKMGMGL